MISSGGEKERAEGSYIMYDDKVKKSVSIKGFMSDISCFTKKTQSGV